MSPVERKWGWISPIYCFFFFLHTFAQRGVLVKCSTKKGHPSRR